MGCRGYSGGEGRLHECRVCASKVGLPLVIQQPGGGVCVYALPHEKVRSAVLSEIVKLFGDVMTSSSIGDRAAMGAYPAAYPNRAVALLYCMLVFFRTDGFHDSESESGSDSGRKKQNLSLAFPDHRIAQVLELIGKYVWRCGKVTDSYVCMYVWWWMLTNTFMMFMFSYLCNNVCLFVCLYVCMYVAS